MTCDWFEREVVTLFIVLKSSTQSQLGENVFIIREHEHFEFNDIAHCLSKTYAFRFHH